MLDVASASDDAEFDAEFDAAVCFGVGCSGDWLGGGDDDDNDVDVALIDCVAGRTTKKLRSSSSRASKQPTNRVGTRGECALRGRWRRSRRRRRRAAQQRAIARNARIRSAHVGLRNRCVNSNINLCESNRTYEPALLLRAPLAFVVVVVVVVVDNFAAAALGGDAFAPAEIVDAATLLP